MGIDAIYEIRVKQGEIIYNLILDRMENIKSDAYIPQTIVIWNAYKNTLTKYLSYIGLNNVSKIDELFGLKVITTELPGILEVY